VASTPSSPITSRDLVVLRRSRRSPGGRPGTTMALASKVTLVIVSVLAPSSSPSTMLDVACADPVESAAMAPFVRANVAVTMNAAIGTRLLAMMTPTRARSDPTAVRLSTRMRRCSAIQLADLIGAAVPDLHLRRIRDHRLGAEGKRDRVLVLQQHVDRLPGVCLRRRHLVGEGVTRPPSFRRRARRCDDIGAADREMPP